MVMMVVPKGMELKYVVWENQQSWENDEKPLAVGDSVKELVKVYPGGLFGTMWVKKKR